MHIVKESTLLDTLYQLRVGKSIDIAILVAVITAVSFANNFTYFYMLGLFKKAQLWLGKSYRLQY